MDPRYSIIIPHYNIPDLLMRCLKSIPVSEDIQVIVVDDNSPDAATYLEKYPELSRPYIEFIRAPKNGGSGYARNIGLDHAKGKWILFADSDDFFVNNMYDIVSEHVESEADVIFFRKQAVSSNSLSECKRSSYLDVIMDIYFKTGDEQPVRNRYYVPWGKMIKKSLIEKYHIRFDEIRYADDVLFSINVGYYANTIEAIDTVLYVVTSREGSATSNFCSKPDELRIRADAAFRYDCFLLQHGVCHQRLTTSFLSRMLSIDRNLFKYYFFTRLEKIYPSKIAALKDISKGSSFRYKLKLYLYSFIIWISHHD